MRGVGRRLRRFNSRNIQLSVTHPDYAYMEPVLRAAHIGGGELDSAFINGISQQLDLIVDTVLDHCLSVVETDSEAQLEKMQRVGNADVSDPGRPWR